MADLDNASKRASAFGMLMPFVLTLPAPDGVIGQGDRAHAGWHYSGVTAALPEYGTVPSGTNPTPATAIPTETPQIFLVLEQRVAS